MSIRSVRAGLETRLASVPGALTEANTQRENKAFTPTPGTPYWRVNLFRGPTENPTMGQGFKRYRGVFLVTLAYPFDQGTLAAETMADAVAAHFARGLSTTANQVTTIFDRDPDVKPGRVAGDRWEIPIGVSYYANVSG